MTARKAQSAKKPAAKTRSNGYKPTGNPVGRPSNASKAASAEPKTAGIAAKYDAAGQGRRMRGWNAPSSGPNVAISGLQTIRDRARDSARNDWSGESGLQKWTTTLIGIGITPRFKRIKSPARRLAIIDLYNDWTKVADADGVLDFYGLQTLAVRSWLEAGEVFIRLRPRSVDANLVVPFQVQLLEAEYVPLFDTDTFPGLLVGNKIRSGIELNAYGRRIAYWMYKFNPNDGLKGRIGTITPTADQLIRIAASQVRHMYFPNRPGALRGVSMFAPLLARLRDTVDYEDAVLLRQKIANLFVAFIKTTLPDGTGGDVDPLTNLPLGRTSSGDPIGELAPGLIQELDPGQSMEFANPPEAGTMFSEYMRTTLMGTAAGEGVPYELFSGDIQNVSDRTLRVIMNEFRRFAKQRQWQVIIPMMCQPCIEGFADAATLAGKVGITESDAVKRVEWAPHGFEYIHPTQDAQGKKIEVDAGFRSRSSVVAERGDDPDQVDQERADDQEREDRLGLAPPDVLGPGETVPGQTIDPNAPAQPVKKGKAATKAILDEQFNRLQAHTNRRFDDLVLKINGIPVYEAPPPEVTAAMFQDFSATVAASTAGIANELTEQRAQIVQIADRAERFEVTFTEQFRSLEARSATDQNANARVLDGQATQLAALTQGLINVAAQPRELHTHVEPTPITVKNDTVNHITAQAGELTVDVNLPERKTVSTVARNAQGDITKVTQTETSVVPKKADT